MNKLLFLVIFLLFPANILANDIIFTEIMYNPSGTESGHEWIEIYNSRDSIVDLEGWTLWEQGTDKSIIGDNYKIGPGEFAVIADDKTKFLFDHPEYKGILFQSSWRYLSNSGEEIGIKDRRGVLIDSILYSGDADDGYSISLDLLHNVWEESDETPGYNDDINQAVPEFNTIGYIISVLGAVLIFRKKLNP